MLKKSTILDTSNELFFVRSGVGIKLLSDFKHNKFIHPQASYRVQDILSFSFNTYFLCKSSGLQNGSQIALTCMQVENLKKSLGITVSDISPPEYAIKILQTDKEVVINNVPRIVEEHGVLKSGEIMDFLTVKVPWYGDEGNIIGLFGASILLGKHSLASCLQQIKRLGILDEHPTFSDFLGREINGIYLTKKETELLYHLIRGKTAKQIAKIYNISFRTVEERINNVKFKFGVSCKNELIEIVVDSLMS